MKNSKLKQGLTWLSISAGLTIVSFGGLLIYGLLIKNNTQPIMVRMVTVTKGKVEDKITGESGVLKLDNQRVIKSATTGTVEEIRVNIGDLVKKEQVLIRLQDQESQIKLQEFELDFKSKTLEIQEKELALQRAEKKLFKDQQEYQKLQKNYINELETNKQEKVWEIEKSQLQILPKKQTITQSEIDLKEAKIKLEEDKQLLARGFISETELQDQEKKVSQAETTLTNAKNELLISQINLDKQKLDLQNFLKSVKENRSESQQKLKEIQDKIEESQMGVQEAKLALNQIMREIDKLTIQRKSIIEELHKTVITSPINGIILNLKVKVGDVIDSKQDILLIGDSTKQIVELNLSPLDATKVKLGQQAEITVVGLDSQKLMGKVKQISLSAKEEDANNNQSSNNVKVTAIVGLNKVNKNIVPSTPVAVSLIISQRNQVLIVPNEAVQGNDSETFVWMKDDQQKAFKKAVKIGLQGLDNMEISSGLKEGDEVLIPLGEAPLNEGNIVTIK